MLAGFTNTGHPSGIDALGQTGADVASRMEEEAGVGEPGRGEQRLGDALVHGGRGACHAGAAVRHSGDLQQPLDGAVLAHGTVQQREHHQRAAARFGDGLDGFHGGSRITVRRLGRAPPAGGRTLQDCGGVDPAAVGGDSDQRERRSGPTATAWATWWAETHEPRRSADRPP